MKPIYIKGISHLRRISFNTIEFIIMIIKKIVLSLLLLITFLLFFISCQSTDKSIDNNVVIVTPSNTNSPSLAVSVTPSEKPIDYNRLKTIIIDELNEFPGDGSLVFYDFFSGETISIYGDDIFESASLVKIPVMVDVYLRADRGELDLFREIELREEDKKGGSGLLKDEPAGSMWTVKELVELMITSSDNTATDILLDLSRMEQVENTMFSLGLKDTTVQRKIFDFNQIEQGRDNLTSPKDMLLLLSIIYESPEISEKYRTEMLNILKLQKNKKMIPKYLPSDVDCAHKTGGLTGVIHDCSIIYVPDRKPYILILMGKNVYDESSGQEIFAQISKRIYEYLKEI